MWFWDFVQMQTLLQLRNDAYIIQLFHISIFTYCIEVWGNACQSYLKPLVILQKRAIRMVAGAQKLDHTIPLFHSLNLLQIKEMYVYCVQLFMYKYHHDCLPNVFYWKV